MKRRTKSFEILRAFNIFYLRRNEEIIPKCILDQALGLAYLEDISAVFCQLASILMPLCLFISNSTFYSSLMLLKRSSLAKERRKDGREICMRELNNKNIYLSRLDNSRIYDLTVINFY